MRSMVEGTTAFVPFDVAGRRGVNPRRRSCRLRRRPSDFRALFAVAHVCFANARLCSGTQGMVGGDGLEPPTLSV